MASKAPQKSVVNTPKDSINSHLDELIACTRENFYTFLLAYTSLQLGGGVLDSIRDDVTVSTSVGLNIEIEPISIVELKQFRADFPDFLLQVFHGKIVQGWKDLLTKIFCHYLFLHFSGQRQFIELKSANVRLDFASATSLDDQVKARLKRDFEFRKYSERQKIINKLLNPKCLYPNELANIHKHIHIRNSFQHNNGILDSFALQDLGTDKIEILDLNGLPISVSKDQRITLSIPELNSFRRSLLMVAQKWRA